MIDSPITGASENRLDLNPRYPKVHENFERHLHVFKQFLSQNDLGTMTARQCEVGLPDVLYQWE